MFQAYLLIEIIKASPIIKTYLPDSPKCTKYRHATTWKTWSIPDRSRDISEHSVEYASEKPSVLLFYQHRLERKGRVFFCTPS